MNDNSIKPNGAPRRSYCVNNHDISIVGREKSRECRECKRKRNRIENLSKEQKIQFRERKLKSYHKRYHDPIIRMKKQTRERINRMEKKLNEHWV
jgi:hypothetical protein